MPVINRIHNDMYTDKTIITYQGKKLNYKQMAAAMDGILKLVKDKRKPFKPGAVYSTTFTCPDGKTYNTRNKNKKENEPKGKDRLREYSISLICDKDAVNFVIKDGKIVKGDNDGKETNKS